MKKFFGFGSSTPHPPPPPSKPPQPPMSKPAPAAPKPAASPVSPPSIVGQWKEPSGSDMTEFKADGTVIERPAGGEMIRGRYSLQGTKLKITLEGVPEDLSFNAVIKSDALEMTDQDGQVTEYRRA